VALVGNFNFPLRPHASRRSTFCASWRTKVAHLTAGFTPYLEKYYFLNYLPLGRTNFCLYGARISQKVPLYGAQKFAFNGAEKNFEKVKKKGKSDI
jgi:hypothetical protein